MPERQPAEAQQQRRTGKPGQPLRIQVYQIVPVDGRHQADQADHHRISMRSQPACQQMQRLAAEHEVRRDEAHIHQHHECYHRHRAHRSELPARLHHLRHAKLRPLCRMQRHEHAAHRVAQHDCQHRLHQAQMIDRGRQRTCHHRQHGDVGGEPDGEQVTRRAVPLVQRYLVDRVCFNCGQDGCHSALSSEQTSDSHERVAAPVQYASIPTYRL